MIFRLPDAIDAGISTAWFIGTFPDASDVTAELFVYGAVVWYHVVAVPFINRVRDDDAENPLPLIVTEVVGPALTAGAGMLIVGLTVKVVVADTVPADTVIV